MEMCMIFQFIIKQVFIVSLSVSSSLTRVADKRKCLPLNDKP